MAPDALHDRWASPRRAAGRIALIYAVFGVLWILFSDMLTGLFAIDSQQLTRIQTIKGWAFIIVTALLVYFLVRSYAAVVRSAAAELHRSEQSYRRIVETANEGICTINTAGEILLANSRFSELVGYTQDELVGEPLLSLVHDDSRHAFAGGIQDGADESASQCDIRLRAKDNREAWAIAAISPLLNEAGCHVGSLVMFTDISERKRLESQLLQFQKMEALGQLAGGIAHDFNNIVTAILGNVDLMRLQLKRRPVPVESLSSDIEQMERAGERAMALTRQLLTFSRRQVIRQELIDLNRLLADMEKMLNRLIREDIQLRVVKGEDIPPVLADAGQLEQVVVNLVVNARDAMPNGGRVTVETTSVELDGEYVSMHPEAKTGPHVVISVSDTGHGMDQATVQRVFEPFFTTKPVGQGTGLGLATVYGIVKQFGGHVAVYSEPGVGSTLRVHLPATRGATLANPTVKTVEPVIGGSETVLVCEDNESIRALVCRVLEEKGYTVLTAGSAAKALDVAEQHNGPIHLLVTDVIMPGMSGPELAEHLHAVRPATKVIYVSGYTSDVIQHHGLVDGEIEFLSKPFTSDALLRRIRRVLDAAQGAPTQTQIVL